LNGASEGDKIVGGALEGKEWEEKEEDKRIRSSTP
jgi:hypothetical protein